MATKQQQLNSLRTYVEETYPEDKQLEQLLELCELYQEENVELNQEIENIHYHYNYEVPNNSLD